MNLEESTLLAHIPENFQWFSGIGAVPWLEIKKEENNFRIESFSSDGELECSRIFTPQPNTFNINHEYKFTYISHCKECTILQNQITYKFYTNED